MERSIRSRTKVDAVKSLLYDAKSLEHITLGMQLQKYFVFNDIMIQRRALELVQTNPARKRLGESTERAPPFHYQMIFNHLLLEHLYLVTEEQTHWTKILPKSRSIKEAVLSMLSRRNWTPKKTAAGNLKKNKRHHLLLGSRFHGVSTLYFNRKHKKSDSCDEPNSWTRRPSVQVKISIRTALLQLVLG
jgi:hypothetical protein